MAKASFASLRVTAAVGLMLLALVVGLDASVATSPAASVGWGAPFIIAAPDPINDLLFPTRPALSENRVAYVIASVEQGIYFRAVVQDLLTGEVRRLEELPDHMADVLLEGDWFVGQVAGGDAPGLYLLNLATGEQRVLPEIGGAYKMPALDNGRLVWVRVDGCCSSDILLYEFATGDITLVTDDGGDNYEYEPDISGDWVVWFTGTPGYFDVRAKNLLTGELLWITDEDGSQGIPQIEYPYIVWSDTRIFDIYGYNLETRERFPIAVGPEPTSYPVIGGGTAFYECGYDWDQLCAHELDGGAEEVIYTCPPEKPFCINLQDTQSTVTATEELVVWLYDAGGAIGLMGARRLTQHTFLPLVRR